MKLDATEFDSRRLAQVRSKETKPERLLRKMLWQNGLRGYRNHPALPGKPDVFFPRYKLAVFVDGYFWHGCPQHFKEPTNNAQYWTNKINRNRNRDRLVSEELEQMAYRVVRMWEHEVKREPDNVLQRIGEALKAA